MGQTVELTLEKVGSVSDKITCKTDQTDPVSPTFTCTSAPALGTVTVTTIAEKPAVSITLKLLATIISTTPYRCTVKVGAVADEIATDTKLIYAQQIHVAYENDDLEKYEKVKKGAIVKVNVYGYDAYKLLPSTCQLGSGTTVSNTDGEFTVTAATAAGLTLTCSLNFDTDSSGTDTANDVTVTYKSPSIPVVESCTASQYYETGTTCTNCAANEYRPTSISQFAGCKMCPPGEKPNTARTSCEKCTAGKHLTDAYVCNDCSAGRYQNLQGQTSCIPCPAGQYQDGTGKTECKNCEAGSHSSQGLSSCTKCPTGTKAIDRTSCIRCEAGTYQDQEGSSTCMPCPLGHHSSVIGSSSVCTPCSAGTYQDKTGQTSCKPCAPGKYQEATGRDSCKDCEAGSYSTSTTCKECPAGTTGDGTSCTSCPIGEYKSNPGQGNCVKCSANQYTINEGSTSCLTCQGIVMNKICTPCGGATNSKYDQTSKTCTACGVGEIAVSGGASCSPCSPGQRRVETTTENQYKCQDCPAGYEQPDSGKDECIKCDAEKGEYQPEDGSTYCKVAPPGFSLKDGDTTKEAEKCLKNTYSTGGAKVCTPCDTAKAQYTDIDGSTYCNICQGNIDIEGNCGATTCEADTIKLQGIGTGEFTFKETSVGTINEVDCDSTSTDKITRYCSYNSLTREGEWANADSSKCSSKYTEDVNKKTDAIKAVDVKDKDATAKAVDDLKKLTTANAENMAAKDFGNIAKTLINLADNIDSNNAEVTPEAVKGVADIVGGVAGVGEEKLSSVSESEKTQMVKCVTSVVTNMQEGDKVETETIALKKMTASEIKEGEDIPLPQPKNEKTTGPKLKMRVTPKNKDEQTIAPTVAVFDKQTALAIFPKPSATLDTTLTGTAAAAQNVEDSIDSSIVSLEFEGSTSLEFDIDISVDTSADGTKYPSNYKLTRTCKFYNEGTSKWDTEGCATTSGSTSSDEITYKCACNHNTSFAIILSAAEIADNTQSTVSTILNAINIVFLAITFLCIVPFRQFRTRRLMQIQTQLCIALLVGHVGFILLGTTPSTSGACVPGVIIVQYLFLVAVAWSVCASVTLYEKIVNALKSFGKQDPHYFIKCLSGCWGAPLFMILATYVSSVAMKDDKIPYISSTGELDDEKTEACWVASPWKWVGFIIPVYLCLIVNVVLFIMIARIIIKAGKSGSGSNHSREVKALVSISTTVCLPWLVALLMTGPKAMAQVFQWIFIIVTSIQGPTMFICFVIFQEDVLSNLFGLVGKEPPKALLAPKSSKSTKSAASEVSHIGPTSTAATKKNAQSDIVNIKNPEYNNPVHQSQENIYSKVDEEAPPPHDDNVSSSSRTSGRHLYESTSFTQHGEKDNNIDPVPAVEQGETYENPSANEMAIAQSSYPHVPQLV